MSSLAVHVALVQFLFATTWTMYVIYLPQLAQQAGLPRQWVPWILVADQVIFAVMDVLTGFWVDRVRANFARFGAWIVGSTVLSGVAFLVLPLAGASAGLLLSAIAIWALSSSALRSPPWALLSRYAATPSIPWVSTVALTGSALAAALAPYLGIALRGVDPRLPFAISTLTLVATVVVLVLAVRRMEPKVSSAEAGPPIRIKSPLFFFGLLVLALGVQVHFALSSAPRYLQFATREQLSYLMPAFWIGFNIAMFPASRMVKRLGPAPAMALAAAAGALAMLLAAHAPGLRTLVIAELLAGGAWGAAAVAAYTGAVALGRTGREGRFLGTLFAILAIAVAVRISLAGSGLAQSHAFSVLQPWLAQALWLVGALLLLKARPR